MRWLRWLNPLIVLVDYWRDKERREAAQREMDRLERERDRENTAALINGMRDIAVKSMETAQANTALFQRFLSTYDIAEPPTLRVFDEEEDDERYIKRKQQSSSTPTALAGLPRAEQFKALIDNLDRFEVGD